MPSTSEKPAKRSGVLSNLAFNIILPVIILSKASGEDALGPEWAIVFALSFPIGYGLWDLRNTGKVNPFSVLGIISVFLTGGFSLLKLDPEYIAIKEAAIPAFIGLGVLFTQRTRFSLVKLILLNDQIFKIDAIYQALAKQHNHDAFEQRLSRASILVASSFFLSSALNYILAKILLVSPPGTAAFNEELGQMTLLSYPVIVAPSMIVLFAAIWYLFSQIKKLTGTSIDHFLIEGDSEADKGNEQP